jgi:hypothetical protein
LSNRALIEYQDVFFISWEPHIKLIKIYTDPTWNQLNVKWLNYKKNNVTRKKLKEQ